MELMVLAYACKTSSSRKITAVMPYLPYCKQSKMRKRGCIVSKLLAKMLGRAGKSPQVSVICLLGASAKFRVQSHYVNTT